MLVGSVVPDTHLQKAIKRARPIPTASELIECIEAHDLGVREGKKAIWVLISHLGPFQKSEFETLRDKYRGQGFSVGDSNRLAALDIAANLPTAHEVPQGLIDAMRPGGGAESAVREGESEGEGAEPAPSETARENKLSGNLDMMAGAGPPSAPATGPCPRGEMLEETVAGRKRGESRGTQFDRLLAEVQELSKGARVGIARSIAWVSANLGLTLERIKAEDVPCAEALSLYMWARKNETEYRRLYDSKRIPAKGITEDDEKGFVDDGDPITDILGRIREALVPKGSTTNVPMRHLQATEPDGSDSAGGDLDESGGGAVLAESGGVHGVPELPAAGPACGDSG